MEQTTLLTVGPCAPSLNTNFKPPGALHALWNDDRGFIISAELVMIATILVLGLIAGLTCVRDAVTGELFDVADAIDSLNQSYSYTGMHGCSAPGCGRHSFTAGSCFGDYEEGEQDECFFDGPCQARCETPACPAEEIIVEPPVVQPPPVIVEPAPYVQPCPTPCPDPCPPVIHAPCPPEQSGTIYYYETSPGATLPCPTPASPCQPGGVWQADGTWLPAPVYPSPIW